MLRNFVDRKENFYSSNLVLTKSSYSIPLICPLTVITIVKICAFLVSHLSGGSIGGVAKNGVTC